MLSASDSSVNSSLQQDNAKLVVTENFQRQFSYIKNVTPVLLREKDLEYFGNTKWRPSLENPLFRDPIDCTEIDNTNGSGLLYTKDTGKSYQEIQNCKHEAKQSHNVQKTDSFSSNRYGISKQNSIRSTDDNLSCDSDGGIDDEVSPTNRLDTSYFNQLDKVGTINVREMANFLERTDSFIRRLEPGSERNQIPAPVASSTQRYLSNRRSWSSEHSSEQYACLSRLNNPRENEPSLQRMEHLIEIQKENAHLKERLIRLQSKLEESERENMRLRDELKQYRSHLHPTNEESLVTFSSFEYSQNQLTRILKRIGIPKVAIERITIQIELEYHRHSNQNYLLIALSYCFDYLMRSFLEETHEFGTSLSEYSNSSNIHLLPSYSDSFKDFVDALAQKSQQSLYNEIKRFVIEQWNVIYNNCSSHHGKTLSEILRDFCTQMEGTLVTALSLETTTIKEGLEQLLMNMLGGGLINQMLANAPKKETILNQHIRILQFVEPAHLEVKENFVNHPHFQTAVTHLQNMVHCRSPKHMLRCLSDAVKTLFSILGSEHSSADDFLPFFIYCTLKSNTYFLLTISDYINLFRNPKDLLMGDGYMLVNLISALQFITTMDANCLSINPIDYQRMYSSAEDAIRDEENKRFSIFFHVCYKQCKVDQLQPDSRSHIHLYHGES